MNGYPQRDGNVERGHVSAKPVCMRETLKGARRMLRAIKRNLQIPPDLRPVIKINEKKIEKETSNMRAMNIVKSVNERKIVMNGKKKWRKKRTCSSIGFSGRVVCRRKTLVLLRGGGFPGIPINS